MNICRGFLKLDAGRWALLAFVLLMNAPHTTDGDSIMSNVKTFSSSWSLLSLLGKIKNFRVSSSTAFCKKRHSQKPRVRREKSMMCQRVLKEFRDRELTRVPPLLCTRHVSQHQQIRLELPRPRVRRGCNCTPSAHASRLLPSATPPKPLVAHSTKVRWRCAFLTTQQMTMSHEGPSHYGSSRSRIGSRTKLKLRMRAA